jgi:glycine cleavage system regulatory protein
MPDLVLTLIGPDRPGIVETVAQPIAAHGGNWLESRMAHLAGKFAGILRIEVPADRVEPLTQALTRLAERGLRVVVEPSPAEPAASGRHLMDLDLEGLDRPGIVRDISHALAGSGVNIEELTTDRSSAAMSGEPLFRARARLDVPREVEAAALRGRLERLAADLMVQVTLADAPAPAGAARGATSGRPAGG